MTLGAYLIARTDEMELIMSTLTQASYIAGEWVTPAGPAFTAVNPASGENLATYNSAEAAQAEQAMAAALDAYQTYRALDKGLSLIHI